MPNSKREAITPSLRRLIVALDAQAGPISETSLRAALDDAKVGWDDVKAFVEERESSYARRRVVRRPHYELLVLTWKPGQGSFAHDHAGSLCGLQVIRGVLEERLFVSGPDSLADPESAEQLGEGGITIDPGVRVHSLSNAPGQTTALVTLHVYSPPLPEMRKYTKRSDLPHFATTVSVFERRPSDSTPRVLVVGGGFSGSMATANLVRTASEQGMPLHVTLVDRQASVGEGVAYRTADTRHVLNVPAGRMSAWPDKPGDFVEWAASRNTPVGANDFVPRMMFGQYVRETLLRTISSAPAGVSFEFIRDEIVSLGGDESSKWSATTKSGRTVRGDALIVALGHRPPDDPLPGRWDGPRTRWVSDPWASLTLSQIEPDEPVLLLGSGLTAVDAMLSLDKPNRTAPVYAISRRGLMPAAHLTLPVSPKDLTSLVSRVLDDPRGAPSVRRLVSLVRDEIETVERSGGDWREVIDGLRPHTARLWGKLPIRERGVFLRHVRGIWEVRRHRMAPSVAESIDRMRAAGRLQLIAGRVESATADADGITFNTRRRGCHRSETAQPLRVAWAVNCTGPGIGTRSSPHPALRGLFDSGALVPDEFGLGVLTDESGAAISAETSSADSTLRIVGTLRKATLWESTAVPELRAQAADAARSVWRSIEKR